MSKHVAIIGAGVVGLCTAYYAVRRGFRVTVIERRAAERDGCSYGNAGMVCPSHVVPLAAPGMVALGLRWMGNPESPFWVKPRLSWDLLSWGWKFWRAANPEHVRRSAPLLRDLHLGSRTCYEELTGELGNTFDFTANGLLMLCKTAHGLEEEAKAAEMARQLGIPAEVLDAKQTAERDPGVRMDVCGSVYYPLDCYLTPHRFMNAMQARVEKLGVQFRWNHEVRGWYVDGGRLTAVRTGGGDVAADEFVLCGGSWSPGLARGLGLKLPMQAGKGYSLTLPRPRQSPRLGHICTEARVAVTPMGGTLRFGGTMEIAGLNEAINPARVRGIIKSALAYYPEFRAEDFDGVAPWCGLRPCSPDGLPYLGRTARYRNLIVATGHAMMGLSLGPITGKLVGEVLAGEKPTLDVGPLLPDRYRS